MAGCGTEQREQRNQTARRVATGVVGRARGGQWPWEWRGDLEREISAIFKRQASSAVLMSSPDGRFLMQSMRQVNLLLEAGSRGMISTRVRRGRVNNSGHRVRRTYG